jgi:hypothetical protein
MKRMLLATAAVFTVAAASVSALSVRPIPDSKITGDYVEARTASVFAGACHYNGEYTVLGRDAVLAYSFASGTYHGVDLSGVRVIAAVSSQTNLAENQARTTDLTIDSSATPAQATAVADLLASRNGAQLGKIVAVHRGTVSFKHDSEGYTVEAPGFASMYVQYMPDAACCKEPGSVWYTPMTSLQGRKVGYTEFANYTGSAASPWQRVNENSAFYGSFSF